MCDQRVKPDILVSIHGLDPGSFPHFWKPENILDGLHKHIIVTHIDSTTSRMLHFNTTY